MLFFDTDLSIHFKKVKNWLVKFLTIMTILATLMLFRVRKLSLRKSRRHDEYCSGRGHGDMSLGHDPGELAERQLVIAIPVG